MAVVLWRLLLLSLLSPLIILVQSDADAGKRDLQHFSAAELTALVSLQNATKNLDLTDASSHLSKLLIPRPRECGGHFASYIRLTDYVANTSNSTLVRQHIVSTFRTLKWDVEEDTFIERTPYGSTKFTNVIATKDPKAATKLVLSAHYDSKFYPKYPDNQVRLCTICISISIPTPHQFVGATDSAVSCAILLDLAQSLDPLFERQRGRFESKDEDGEKNSGAHTTFQIIFFDGEEAFKEWTATDSKYGSR